MEDLTAVATITGSLKAAADTLKIIVGLGRGAEFRAKTDELRSQINAAMSDALTAYEAQSTQLQRIRQLEKEAGDVEAWRLKEPL